ncbi:MAG: ribonuclease III [Anaerolineae bacterium]
MVASSSWQARLVTLQDNLGFAFTQPALLQQALTHPSFINESPSIQEDDNQRLEFLGDALLGFLVGEWLYSRYPEAREGELTSLRAHLVRTESLAGFAREFDAGVFLRFGRGEATSGGSLRDANLCDAFEAIIGAMYLDAGLERTRTWLYELLQARAGDIDAHRRARDSKSQLQEYVQGRLKVTPLYHIIHSEGPDHAKQFTAEVSVNEIVWGQGSGLSKQAAEQAAAAAALCRANGEG